LIAIVLACGGCSPEMFRRDADRQVQRLIQDEQQKTIGYKPAVSVPVNPDQAPTKKSYARMPTTELPGLLTDVVFTARPPTRKYTLGPDVNTEPATETVNTFSAIDRVRNFTREPFKQGPPATISSAHRFSLFDSIGYAVENSRAYQTQMESLYLAALDVTLERHLFEPRPFANVRLGYDGGQGDVNYRSALNVTSEAGVRQRLPLGGEIVASGLVGFINALSDNTADGETAELALRGSIPLLRGFGMVNLESLIQSERNVIYSVRNFESYRRNFAISVASNYFRLITAQQSIRNRYVRYVSNVELTNRTEALFDAGRITALEVQRAQQELLQSEDDVNSSLRNYEDQLDQFKLVLGMPVDDALEIVPIQVDVPVPELEFDVSADLAKKYRLDLQTTRDRVDDARRRLENAKNNLLPDLTLSGGASVGNNNNEPARDLDADTTVYDAALTLDLPIDRVSERNQLRASLISLEAARREVIQAEDQVVSDVRSSIRGIRSAIVSLELQRKGIEIADQRLEFANESLLLGRTSDSRNVVEAQNSLLQAQDRYDQARANLQVAILSYLRDTGVLRLDPESGELGLAMKYDDQTRDPERPAK
jgi:outer membrane protein TolC